MHFDVTIDARKFENGRVHSHGEICPERSLPVAPFMERYLLNLGLNRNNADVGFGRLWISGYHGADSCMMDDNVFGDYANHKYITIRPRKSDMRSDGPAEIDVRFKDEFDGHVHMDIKCLCFEYLEVPFRDFLSCNNMLEEDVTFEWRGRLVFAPRTTAHELFTGEGLASGDTLTITVKVKRRAVLVRVLNEYTSFQKVCMEKPSRLISMIMTDVARSRGLIIEACTFEICNFQMDRFWPVLEAMRLADVKPLPPAAHVVLRITGGSKRELEELVVTAGIQVAGHKRALEAQEQRARILVANAERDKHAHEHTVDFTRRHYEDALRFQKRVNEINAMHVSDQAILVSDASASLEMSERKRARLEVVLAALEPAEPVPAPAPAEERVCLGECVVCFAKMFLGDSTMLFLPCGHAKVCVQCIPATVNLKVCPVCRTEIETTTAVFL